MHGSRGPDRFPLTITGCLMRSSRETSAARAPEVQLNEEQAARQKVFEVGGKIIKRGDLRPLIGGQKRVSTILHNWRSTMPKVSNIDIFRKREQPTVSIRTRTNVEHLPVLIGESYYRIADYLKELGELVSDVPYVAYYNMDMQRLDVEIGFPVSKILPGKGDIHPGSIPEGNVVSCMYRGPYREMVSTYTEMANWIEKNGLKPTGTVYECYYNGPEYPENELLTMIVMPVV